MAAEREKTACPSHAESGPEQSQRFQIYTSWFSVEKAGVGRPETFFGGTSRPDGKGRREGGPAPVPTEVV